MDHLSRLFTEVPSDAPSDEDEFALPAYGTPGWVLVEILGTMGKGYYGHYDIEECAVDEDRSTFWIKEGTGVAYWLDEVAPDNLDPGWYVFEGVIGNYIRGDGWVTDDDEEWEYSRLRWATPTEIAMLAVEPMPDFIGPL